MVYCLGQRCTLEIACRDADDVTVCGDGMPACCKMQRRIGDVWFALLILPVGRHTFRYFARLGARTTCVGRDTVSVSEAESWQNSSGP